MKKEMTRRGVFSKAMSDKMFVLFINNMLFCVLSTVDELIRTPFDIKLTKTVFPDSCFNGSFQMTVFIN